MVFTGKPSKGCGNCRSRKIKCDQTRPACLECIRTNRQCLGYRDEISLMFRDETQVVVQKARSSELSRNASRAALVSTHPAISSRQGPSLGPGPDAPVSEHDAVCFFLQSHAIPGIFQIKDTLANSLSCGSSNGSPSQQAVQCSIRAVASAMLSRVRRLRSLSQIARQEYGSALKVVNQALADPNEAKEDATLFAVVLLALYEVVLSRAPQGIEGWTNHLCGAAALLQHRGVTGLQSIVGIRLFLHLRYQIVISCLQRDVFVPTSLMERTKLDMIPEIKNALGNKLILIIGNLANLRAELHTAAITSPQEIYNAARVIEADLITWLTTVPSDFMFSTHKVSPTDRSFECRFHGLRPYNDEYHIYADIWSPNVWNHYRCARILVSELILAQAHKLSHISPTILTEDFRFYCKSLRSTASHLAADICRSVPFHLGACNAEVVPDTPILPSESYIGGLMLLWPLFVAGIVEGPAHPQRRWVVQCFQTIGNTWGLAQALASMDLLTVDPGMFSSSEMYGEAADSLVVSAGILPVSIYHVSYHSLPAMKQYRELQASSA